MKRMLLVVLILLLSCSAWAAGTITCTKQSGSTAVYTCSATADATNATGTVMMSGYVMRVVTLPGAGDEAPSGAWACTLADPSGVDVLGGAVTGRSTTDAEHVYPLDPGGSAIFPYVQGLATMTCTSIGDGNTATITLYVKE